MIDIALADRLEMALEKELAFFESNRQEWLKDHDGEFVLIKGEEFAFFDTDDQAYESAIGKYGNQDIFIKQVLAKDRVEDSLSLMYGLVHVRS